MTDPVVAFSSGVSGISTNHRDRILCCLHRTRSVVSIFGVLGYVAFQPGPPGVFCELPNTL